MTAESGLRYNGLKKYMFSGAANIQRPDIVVEKTVEVCRLLVATEIKCTKSDRFCNVKSCYVVQTVSVLTSLSPKLVYGNETFYV